MQPGRFYTVSHFQDFKINPFFHKSHFQRYVNNSKWKVCEHFQQGGHWRHLIVRSNHLNELMLIVIIHPQQLGEEEIREEMNNMAQYMLSSCKDLNLKSIYYQTWYVSIIVLTLFQNDYFPHNFYFKCNRVLI